jgi:DNA/RNA-binding domain of Phe-tRNA-synthetase-like protein
VSDGPLVREGLVEAALAEEWPGLRIDSTAFDAVPGASPPELRDRLKLLSDRFRGAQAIALRQQPIPHAYRVFFRHIGLEPDEERVPVEALALERMKRGGFESRNALDDAITIAVMETGVPVWALDGDRVEGELVLRTAVEGEPLGGGDVALDLPAGRIVVADERRALAVLFRQVAPDVGVTPATRSLLLFSVAVPGVPPIHVEEALWTVWDTIGSSA